MKPQVWRRLDVASDLTLRDLHHVLQVALGWTDSHLHEFHVDGARYGLPDPEETYGEPCLDERKFLVGRHRSLAAQEGALLPVTPRRTGRGLPAVARQVEPPLAADAARQPGVSTRVGRPGSWSYFGRACLPVSARLQKPTNDDMQ